MTTDYAAKKEKYTARLAHLEKDAAYFASKKSPKLAVCERKIAEVKALIAKCEEKAGA